MGTSPRVVTMMKLLLALAAITMLVSVESMSLSKANFDAEVFDSGKNALVKFQAPW